MKSVGIEWHTGTTQPHERTWVNEGRSYLDLFASTAEGQADREAGDRSPDTTGTPKDDRLSGSEWEDAERHLVRRAQPFHQCHLSLVSVTNGSIIMILIISHSADDNEGRQSHRCTQ